MSSPCRRISIMASNAVVAGPTAKRVAANIERVRKARQLKQKDVSDALGAIGRPTLATVVSKIERGERRIDVDDVVALALALNVSPLTLLMPDEASGQPVKLTEGFEVDRLTAWGWALGRGPAADWSPDRVGYPIGPGDDPVAAAEADEREQDYNRQRAEYLALALPPELRRAADQSAVRVARQLAELLEDLATAAAADEPVALLRMARRRHQQLGLELEELEERLKA